MKKETVLIAVLVVAAALLLILTAVILADRRGDPLPNPGTTVRESEGSDQPTESTPDSDHGMVTDPPVTTDPTIPPVTPPVTNDPNGTDEPITNPPETTAPETTAPPVIEPGKIQHVYKGSLPASEKVNDSWFADALFIGDSRTVGLDNFSGIASTYYADTSLNISQARTKAFIEDSNQVKHTILSKIEQDGQIYSKVYLWFGLNDLGSDYPTIFINLYRKLIEDIRALLPSAQIYVIAVVPVSQKYADNSPYGVTNEKAHIFNTLIAEMTRDMGIYFVNAAEDFSDEHGALRAQTRDGKSISLDGAHFTVAAVKEFFDYLRTHTVAVSA